MSTINITKSVQRSDLLYPFIKNSYSTLTDVAYDGTTVKLVFSDNQIPNQTAITTLVNNYVDPLLDQIDTSSSLSIFNSTQQQLAASGVYTGSWEDMSVYSNISINISGSTGGSLQIQQGFLSKRNDSARTYLAPSGIPLNVVFSTLGRYFRLVFSNSTTTQTTFNIATYSNCHPQLNYSTASDAADDSSSTIAVKGFMNARNMSNSYGPLKMSEFNELKVTHPTYLGRAITSINKALVTVSYSYSINTDYNVTSGAVTWNAGRAVVSASGAGTTSILSSQRYIVCSGASNICVYVAVAFSTPVAGNVQLAGCGTTVNGLFIGYNGLNFGVMTRTLGVDTWIYSSSFTNDLMNGTGPSGYNLIPTAGNTYMIQYDAMGYGNVQFCVMVPRNLVMFHTIDFPVVSTSNAVGLSNPQFPLYVSSINTTATSNQSIYVTAMAAFGDTNPYPQWTYRRTIDASATITSTSYQPIMVLQNKSTFQGTTNTSSVRILAISLNTQFTGQTLNHDHFPIFLSIIEFPTLTGPPTYTDMNTANSTVSVSYNATGVSGGNTLFTMCAIDGSSMTDLTAQELYISPGASVCVAAKMAFQSNYYVSAVLCYAEYQ
jgi:hypothetical protein